MAFSVSISGSPAYPAVGTPQIRWDLGRRATASFLLRSHPSMTRQHGRPVTGARVVISYDGTPRFAGVIFAVTETHPWAWDDLDLYSCECVSAEYYLDKISPGPVVFGLNFVTQVDTILNVLTIPNNIFANGYPIRFTSSGALPGGITAGATYYVINHAGDTLQIAAIVGGSPIDLSSAGTGQTYAHWTAGSAIRAMMQSVSVFEGISVGTIAAGATIQNAAYDSDVSVSSAISSLADLSDMVWWVDPTYTLQVVARGSSLAGFAISQSAPGILARQDVTVRRTLEQIANRVRVRHDAAFTPLTNVTLTASGSQRQYWLASAIKTFSTLVIGGTEQDVGVWGNPDDAAKPWFYAPSDRWIVQNPSNPPLANGTQLIVSYYALGFDFVEAEDTAAQLARAAIEGGSGIATRWVSETSLSRTAAQAAADADLAYLKIVPDDITYLTRLDGIIPGMVQSVDLPKWGVTANCLIQSVAATLDPDGVLAWEVHAVTARVKDGIDTFRLFLGGGGGSGGGSATGGGSGGGGGGAVYVTRQVLAASPTTITAPAPVTGGQWYLTIQQPANTTHTIQWPVTVASGTTTEIPPDGECRMHFAVEDDNLWHLYSTGF